MRLSGNIISLCMSIDRRSRDDAAAAAISIAEDCLKFLESNTTAGRGSRDDSPLFILRQTLDDYFRRNTLLLPS